MTFSLDPSSHKKIDHHINADDVLKYGMQKACILGNISSYKDVEKNQMHQHFPYIKKKKFYSLLKELISKGLIAWEGENE